MRIYNFTFAYVFMLMFFQRAGVVNRPFAFCMKLIIYSNPLLLSDEPIIILDEFAPCLDLFCHYLEQCGLKFFVTQSSRLDKAFVPGAVVPPAKMGNHLICCAIDGNLVDEKGIYWSNEKMKRPDAVIAWFISLVKGSGVLRYGGDFHTPDRVHYDNGLNISDPERWRVLHAFVQQELNKRQAAGLPV